MRKLVGIFFVVASSALAAVGCGGGSGSSAGGSGGSGASGGTGGSGGTTMSTTTTTTTSSTSSSSSSSSTGCTGLAPTGDCATCSEGACCAEIADCNTYDGCIDCIFNDGDCSDPTIQDSATALLTCLVGNCKSECGPPPCNPVTNEPCDTASGEACDFGSYGYQCYAPPNTQGLCDPCGSADGYCAGGLTCDGTCAKFCCDDGDCGTGTCNKEVTGDPAVGVCYDANMMPVCDAPLESPSGGSCVTL